MIEKATEGQSNNGDCAPARHCRSTDAVLVCLFCCAPPHGEMEITAAVRVAPKIVFARPAGGRFFYCIGVRRPVPHICNQMRWPRAATRPVSTAQRRNWTDLNGLNETLASGFIAYTLR